jgi:hypothetical protein
MGVNRSSIASKTFIHGSLVSLNLPTTVSQKRIDQIDQLFPGQDLSEFISLQSVFTWSCNPSTNKGFGAGSTTVDCGTTGNTQQALSSLIVIEKDIPSLLLKN